MRTLTMLKVPAALIAAVLAVASLAPAAQAQEQESGFTAKMNVPFAFEAGARQHFAPGIYTIRMNGQQTMLIRGATSGLALIQLASDSLPAIKGKAVFSHYGDKYFLRSVSVAGGNSHVLCYRSKAEREMEVATGKMPTAVELALLQTGR
jgi:hypothetical protein